jgi:hypothetical protein
MPTTIFLPSRSLDFVPRRSSLGCMVAGGGGA